MVDNAVILGVKLIPEFTHFFLYFGPYLLFFFPIKSYTPGLFLYARCFHQCRQRCRDAAQKRAVAFFQLYLFPITFNIVFIVYFGIAVNVRVPVYQLITYAV